LHDRLCALKFLAGDSIDRGKVPTADEQEAKLRFSDLLKELCASTTRDVNRQSFG
jgi:hypothetical protein